METISDNLPMVSVWMITYNHEKFIAKAIESVLMQQCKFKIEIVIGDDNSSDDTSEIIYNYQNQYPDIIRARINTTNKGMMPNMIETLSECKGKYIALLEGDDYWIYPNKLQTQIDFLESHPEYSFSFHNALVVYDGSKKEPHAHTSLREGEYSGDEIISDWIVPTASVLFRNTNINWPNFSLKCVHGDILLFLLLLENGKAFAFNETWSVYRKNENSVTLINPTDSNYIKKVIRQQQLMNSLLKKKYDSSFKERLKYWWLALLSAHMKKHEFGKLMASTLTIFISNPIFILKTVFKNRDQNTHLEK